MVSLQRCRELLGNDTTLPDSALELLRDQFYVLADITTTELLTQRQTKGVEPLVKFGRFEEFAQTATPDEEFEAEERAAILEYDAGLNRQQAERVVVMEHWRNRKRGMVKNGSNLPKTK